MSDCLFIKKYIAESVVFVNSILLCVVFVFKSYPCSGSEKFHFSRRMMHSRSYLSEEVRRN